MEVMKLASWEEFETTLPTLYAQSNDAKKASAFHTSPLLFRGQANADWKLQTTLERCLNRKHHSFKEYFQTAYAAKPHFEVFTGKQWSIMRPDEYGKRLEEGDTFAFLCAYPGLTYLAYLRHHGFPSPLLDWSQSPYISAYFAFRHPDPEAEYVAIYAHLEAETHSQSQLSGRPRIWSFGPNLSAHPRHFLQQSQYTICYMEKEEGDLFYAPHESVVNGPKANQDTLWKMEIPVSERGKALRRLLQMNITAHSLFNSEESLAEALSIAIQIRNEQL